MLGFFNADQTIQVFPVFIPTRFYWFFEYRHINNFSTFFPHVGFSGFSSKCIVHLAQYDVTSNVKITLLMKQTQFSRLLCIITSRCIIMSLSKFSRFFPRGFNGFSPMYHSDFFFLQIRFLLFQKYNVNMKFFFLTLYITETVEVSYFFKEGVCVMVIHAIADRLNQYSIYPSYS